MNRFNSLKQVQHFMHRTLIKRKGKKEGKYSVNNFSEHMRNISKYFETHAKYFRTQRNILNNQPISCHSFFLYPLKISENQRFSDVFRGYRKIPVA